MRMISRTLTPWAWASAARVVPGLTTITSTLEAFAADVVVDRVRPDFRAPGTAPAEASTGATEPRALATTASRVFESGLSAAPVGIADVLAGTASEAVFAVDFWAASSAPAFAFDFAAVAPDPGFTDASSGPTFALDFAT